LPLIGGKTAESNITGLLELSAKLCGVSLLWCLLVFLAASMMTVIFNTDLFLGSSIEIVAGTIVYCAMIGVCVYVFLVTFRKQIMEIASAAMNMHPFSKFGKLGDLMKAASDITIGDDDSLPLRGLKRIVKGVGTGYTAAGEKLSNVASTAGEKISNAVSRIDDFSGGFIDGMRNTSARRLLKKAGNAHQLLSMESVLKDVENPEELAARINELRADPGNEKLLKAAGIIKKDGSYASQSEIKDAYKAKQEETAALDGKLDEVRGDQTYAERILYTNFDHNKTKDASRALMAVQQYLNARGDSVVEHMADLDAAKNQVIEAARKAYGIRKERHERRADLLGNNADNDGIDQLLRETMANYDEQQSEAFEELYGALKRIKQIVEKGNHASTPELEHYAKDAMTTTVSMKDRLSAKLKKSGSSTQASQQTGRQAPYARQHPTRRS
jgi:hypothetical protein